MKSLFRERQIGKLGDSVSCIHEMATIVEAEALDINIDPIMHEACAVDLAKFCRDIGPGD